MYSFRGAYGNRGNGAELRPSDVVPLTGLACVFAAGKKMRHRPVFALVDATVVKREPSAMPAALPPAWKVNRKNCPCSLQVIGKIIEGFRGGTCTKP